MRIAALIKQVPRFEAMHLRPDGRLERDGLELEMNPYCRRAVSKGVELARASQGTCTAVTLGPAPAEEVLREAIACGATDGLLISDRAFAGSDTLATAKALAAALTQAPPFDLILTGRNSVDADTGQVGPELAQLLGLPFVGGARSLEIDGAGNVRARCEYDDGWVEIQTSLPAVVSCAERLCDPAKADPSQRSAVHPGRIQRLDAADLGPGPWGQPASPTQVGPVRLLASARQGLVLSGTVDAQVHRAIDVLADRGALTDSAAVGPDRAGKVPDRVPTADGPVVAVLLEPGRRRVGRELLGSAAAVAFDIGGTVTALGWPERLMRSAQGWGADLSIELTGSSVEEDVAGVIGPWVATTKPWALLAPGTMWGREVASRIAARLGAGLTGDVVDLGVAGGRLVAWKPAFGGRLVASITSSSETQMATIRPGVFPLRTPRAAGPMETRVLSVPPTGRVRHLNEHRDADADRWLAADVVIGVGTGVPPEEYPALEPLRLILGAELAATRKVTDRGWLPRSRQVGITGHSIGPRLYIAIGLSGKFNHMVGVRCAGQILAINAEPTALVFAEADVGIVADWRDVIPLLAAGLSRRRAGTAPPPSILSGDAVDLV